MKNILIAISQPEDADQLISETIKIIHKKDTKLWIVHVTEADPEDFIALEAGPQYIYDKRAVTRREARKFVEEKAAEIIGDHGIPAEGLMINGSVAKTIQKIVSDYNIDLVIAGHRKRDFLYNLFATNQKKDLVDELKIPLLVVPLQT